MKVLIWNKGSYDSLEEAKDWNDHSEVDISVEADSVVGRDLLDLREAIKRQSREIIGMKFFDDGEELTDEDFDV